MANKFTRMVDHLFETYGPDKKIILLCRIDEHDYEEWDYWAFASGTGSGPSKEINPSTEELGDKFSDEKDVFDQMLLDSFGDVFDFEFESRRCDDDFSIWVYVTRDYKVCSKFTDQSLLTRDNADRVLVDLTSYSEESADGLHDKQSVERIGDLVEKLNELISGLESEDGKAKARELLAQIKTV